MTKLSENVTKNSRCHLTAILRILIIQFQHAGLEEDQKLFETPSNIVKFIVFWKCHKKSVNFQYALFIVFLKCHKKSVNFHIKEYLFSFYINIKGIAEVIS